VTIYNAACCLTEAKEFHLAEKNRLKHRLHFIRVLNVERGCVWGLVMGLLLGHFSCHFMCK